MSANKRKASGSAAAVSAPMSISAGMSSKQASQPGGAPSTAKRSKVDHKGLEDEDLAGDLDLQDQERKRLQQGRKGRVVTSGYDSEEDSEESEAGEDMDEADARGDGKIADVDEDDDMFNLEAGDSEGEEGVKRRKHQQKGKKKFLELGDIEGQEFDAKDNDEEERDPELELETDEEQYEVDEEEKEALHDPGDVIQPLRKRKKRPKSEDKEDMGFEIDSFNMKNEMAAGRFDEEGNYIANARDPHAEHDKWLTGNYSRKGIQAAKEAHERREREMRRKESNEATMSLDEDECKMKLAELMRRGESVLETVQRLGAEVKKSGKKDKGAGRVQDGKQVDDFSARSELEQVTSLSSALMSRFGRINIYDETYEALLRVVRRSGLVRETWDPAATHQGNSSGRKEQEQEAEQNARQFTYKWSPSYLAATSQSPNNDVEIFGPYAGADLQMWYRSGYFGDRGERILLKQEAVDDESASSKQGWKRWEQVFDV